MKITWIVLYIDSKPAEEPEEPGNGPTEDADAEDASSTADVKDPTEYEQVFKPKTSLGRSFSHVYIYRL